MSFVLIRICFVVVLWKMSSERCKICKTDDYPKSTEKIDLISQMINELCASSVSSIITVLCFDNRNSKCLLICNHLNLNSFSIVHRIRPPLWHNKFALNVLPICGSPMNSGRNINNRLRWASVQMKLKPSIKSVHSLKIRIATMVKISICCSMTEPMMSS